MLGGKSREFEIPWNRTSDFVARFSPCHNEYILFRIWSNFFFTPSQFFISKILFLFGISGHPEQDTSQPRSSCVNFSLMLLKTVSCPPYTDTQLCVKQGATKCKHVSDVFSKLQGAGTWLAGTHTEKHVAMSLWLSEEEIQRRQNLSMDWAFMLNKALENLHQCLWIGILEEREKSMELLQYQTGLQMEFKDIHIGQRAYPSPSPEEIAKIMKLMPVDMYIYDYAKQLFENNWYWYLANVKKQKQGARKPPVFQEMIDGCVSAPNYMKCPGEKEWTGDGPDGSA